MYERRLTPGDVNKILDEGMAAYAALSRTDPEVLAGFLVDLADRIDRSVAELSELAHQETALPVSPRLRDVEIPRTTDQLRQAAAAVRARSWRDPIINRSANVARIREPMPGVVFILGPNNFPFAFNAIGGGDFAAAIGSGHPVLARANPGHPQTSLKLASLAAEAIGELGLPDSTVQVVLDVPAEVGLSIVADKRTAASAFTGSRKAGLALKRAADAAGRPIYLEMSAVNPLVVLVGAAADRTRETARDIASSLITGSGQFCTKPGLVFVPESHWPELRSALEDELSGVSLHPLLSKRTRDELASVVAGMRQAGAGVAVEVPNGSGERSFPSTVLEIDTGQFLANSAVFTREAFGNATTVIKWGNESSLITSLARLEGTLASGVYLTSHDRPFAREVVDVLRRIAGRITFNKPTTGVQVVEAMNHGGPYPATGHPGFTAVGIPESFKRFTQLVTYDGFEDSLLPPELQSANPLGIRRTVFP